ncbi:MAG TPA: asparagine synthase-related protein, partial [Thermoplasmata archaeon]|nr:asparagine synthase-related protein [Thermoplasmata archaeon]
MSVGRKLPALDTATRLVEPFLSAVRRAVAGHPRVVVLYSGGLDSTLLAECLRDVRPTLFSVGVPGASDLAAASTGASGLGLHHAMCEVIVHDVEMAIERFGSDIETLREPYRSVAVAEAISLLRAPPGLLVTGQGADELFHGYAHFRGLSLADRLSRASADLERLTEHEWPRFQRM